MHSYKSLKLDGITQHEWSLLPPYHLGLLLCAMNVKLLCGRCIINIGNRLLVGINGPLWYNQIKCYKSFLIFFLLNKKWPNSGWVFVHKVYNIGKYEYVSTWILQIYRKYRWIIWQKYWWEKKLEKTPKTIK